MSQFMKKMFYKQRADFEKDAIQRDQNYSLPEDVIEHKNIYYSNDKQKEHRLDIYYPASKSTSPLPVIINVHGGGLLLGNKEFNRPFCAKLCQAGYLVFSIEYRLIPDCLSMISVKICQMHLILSNHCYHNTTETAVVSTLPETVAVPVCYYMPVRCKMIRNLRKPQV